MTHERRSLAGEQAMACHAVRIKARQNAECRDNRIAGGLPTWRCAGRIGPVSQEVFPGRVGGIAYLDFASLRSRRMHCSVERTV